eukprot:4568209-Amphidinium_carterae.2
MQLNTRRSFEGKGRKRNLAPRSSPSRTVMHTVLKVFNSLSTANTEAPAPHSAWTRATYHTPPRAALRRLDIVF